MQPKVLLVALGEDIGALNSELKALRASANVQPTRNGKPESNT